MLCEEVVEVFRLLLRLLLAHASEEVERFGRRVATFESVEELVQRAQAALWTFAKLVA